MREYAKCALRNLGRKKFRTWLTIASIAIGVASVVLIETIGSVGKYAIDEELNSLGFGSLAIATEKRREDIQLQESDLLAITEVAPVENAVPVMLEYSTMTMRGLVGSAAIWGVGAGANQVFALSAQHGALFTQADVATGANVCLVDASTAMSFYHRENIVGKRLQLLIGGSQEEFTVIGVVESGGNAMQSLISQYLPMFVYVPYTTMQRLSGRPGFDQIAVTVRGGEEVELAAAEIIRTLEHRNNTSGGYAAENIAQQKEQLNHVVSIITMVLSAVAGVSLVVAGLGIMTVMLVSVTERTKEIGIKKSIGASRAIILLEFLTEALTISLLGGMAGAGIGALLALVGCLLTGMRLLLSVKTIVFAIGFAVALGVTFGIYPSWIACKMKPVDALRFE